jgi:hypothetical protein
LSLQTESAVHSTEDLRRRAEQHVLQSVLQRVLLRLQALPSKRVQFEPRAEPLDDRDLGALSFDATRDMVSAAVAASPAQFDAVLAQLTPAALESAARILCYPAVLKRWASSAAHPVVLTAERARALGFLPQRIAMPSPPFTSLQAAKLRAEWGGEDAFACNTSVESSEGSEGSNAGTESTTSNDACNEGSEGSEASTAGSRMKTGSTKSSHVSTVITDASTSSMAITFLEYLLAAMPSLRNEFLKTFPLALFVDGAPDCGHVLPIPIVLSLLLEHDALPPSIADLHACAQRTKATFAAGMRSMLEAAFPAAVLRAQALCTVLHDHDILAFHDDDIAWFNTPAAQDLVCATTVLALEDERNLVQSAAYQSTHDTSWARALQVECMCRLGMES